MRTTRLFLGLLTGATAVVGLLAPAAGALPSGDPYSDIGPQTAYPMPDLVVSIRFVSVTDATGAWGGDKPILTVKNIGNKRASASSVTLHGKERDQAGYTRYRTVTSYVPALDPGQSYNSESGYFRRPCYVWVSATADSAKVISESNENNNVAYKEITRCIEW
jgi:hypothetical protein